MPRQRNLAFKQWVAEFAGYCNGPEGSRALDFRIRRYDNKWAYFGISAARIVCPGAYNASLLNAWHLQLRKVVPRRRRTMTKAAASFLLLLPAHRCSCSP